MRKELMTKVEETLVNGKIFEGLAMSSTMFNGDCTIERVELTTDEMKQINEEFQNDDNFFSCVNKTHVATLDALRERYNIDVKLPEEVAPKVSLQKGDALLVLSVVGLPRLVDRTQYTAEEVDNAKFSFVMYFVK